MRRQPPSAWPAKAPHLLLLEVADGLNGQFAFEWRRGVAWLQLDDGLGSFVQTRHQRLEFIQLLSLLLSLIDVRSVNVARRRRPARVSGRDSPRRPAAGPPAAWLWWSGRSCTSSSCSPASSSSCPERLSHRQRTAQGRMEKTCSIVLTGGAATSLARSPSARTW